MAHLSDSEIADRLKALSGWAVAGIAIEKEFKFADFKAAMAFVNRVAGIAEELDHHPDIFVSYSRVRLTLSSHDSGGVTERDFRLASRIDSP
jgi:4a-hydroxytetrahydrobiopterin dehydratase